MSATIISSNEEFASRLGLRRRKGAMTWWTYDALLDAAVVRYWETVRTDPARRKVPGATAA